MYNNTNTYVSCQHHMLIFLLVYSYIAPEVYDVTMLERIKGLCKDRGISVSILENKLDLPHNTIYQRKSRTPGTERLQKVADYFNVSTDYLLGRFWIKFDLV